MKEASEKVTAAKAASKIIVELGKMPLETIIDEMALAEMFDRCPTTVKRAIERGELPPSVRMFGKPCWTVGAIISYVEARLEAARKEAERDAIRISKHSPFPPGK